MIRFTLTWLELANIRGGTGNDTLDLSQSTGHQLSLETIEDIEQIYLTDEDDFVLLTEDRLSANSALHIHAASGDDRLSYSGGRSEFLLIGAIRALNKSIFSLMIIGNILTLSNDQHWENSTIRGGQWL